jgi:hypothetical protein
MNIFLKNKLGYSLLFGGLVFIFSLIFFSSQVLANSEIYLAEFNIEKSSFDPAEKINGSFTLWNNEDSFVPDLTYRFKLLAGDEKGYFSIVWDDQSSGDNFSISSNQKVPRSFVYQLPKNLSAGDYKFRVQVCNPKGVIMAWKEVLITVKKTEGAALTLQSGIFLKNGEKAGEETIYDLGKTPKITFDVLNKSSSTVRAYPMITIYRDNISESLVKEIKGDLISLNPGYVQNEKTDLIGLADLNTYICRVVMHDQNGEPISNAIYLRWAISENGGTEIIRVRTDRSSYESGEEANVSVEIGTQSGGVAEKGEMLVKIVNGQKEVVGEMKKEIDLKRGEVNIGVPITKKVSNPKVEVTITDKENKELDRYPIGSLKTESEGSSVLNVWLAVIFLAAIGLAASIAVRFFRKKKSRLNRMRIFILIISATGWLLGAIQSVKAEEIVSSGPVSFDLDMSWNDPLPLHTYNAGKYTSFSGSVFVGQGLWTKLENTQIDLFVGNLNDAVLKDDPITKVKAIDEDNEQNKINLKKIGTFPGYYNSADGAVEYDLFLKLPQDLPYSGKSRFYVQFKGQIVKASTIEPWSWLIAYQEVNIQKFGEGGLDIILTADKDKVKEGDVVSYTASLTNRSSCIRTPVDVVAVVDRSSSMKGQPLNDAKESVGIFIDEMDPAYDRIGLASYESASSLDSGLTADFDAVKSAADRMVASGEEACISCGIDTANKELAANKRPEAAQYEVLMTDGQANKCVSSCSSPFQEVISKAKDSSASIFTVGFGSDSAGAPPKNCGNPPSNSCALLNVVASGSDGIYFYASAGEQLKETYRAIAGVLIGKSFDTKATVKIPVQYFTMESYDETKCDFSNNVLVCDVGFMDCGGKISEEIKFKLKVKGISNNVIINTEVKAANSSGQEKSGSLGITATVKNPPRAEISCDPGECKITGCSSPGCCQCYSDSILKLINKSSPNSDSNIEVSTWYIKKQGEGDSSYSVMLSALGKVDLLSQKLAAGNYTVKLKVADSQGLYGEATKDISYFQGVEAGFSCSMNGRVWYNCDSPDFKPAKGGKIWLSDDRPDLLEHSTLSGGAANPKREWSKIGNGVKFTFSSGSDNSIVSTVLEDLPTVIRLELNDGNRPKTVFVEHTIDSKQ